MRPDKETYFMQLAYMAARRATCDRKHVGSVIVTPDGRTVSTGYNGAPSNVPSCDDIGHELLDGHCIRTIHAEANAIAYAGRNAWGCTLYATVIPCYDCAKLIVNAGIERVVYDEFYSSRYGKSSHVADFLVKSNVDVKQLDTPGLTLFKQLLSEMEKKERAVVSSTLVEYRCGCKLAGDIASLRCPQHDEPRVHE